MIRGTQPRIRCAELLAGGGGGALRLGQAIAIDRVRGVDVGQCLACGGLTRGRRRDLGAKGVALLGQASLADPERGHLAIGPPHAFFGHRRRRLRARPPVLGIAPRRFTRA